MRVFILYCLVACSVMSMVVADAAAADRLEGKWVVTVSPDDDARKAGEKDFEDTLVFKGGQFTAEACVPYGFGPAPYEADTRGSAAGATSFTATLKSETDGTAKWSGTATANQIQGELLWIKKDGNELHYTYKGQRQK